VPGSQVPRSWKPEHSLTAPAEPGSLEQVHALLQALWAEYNDVTPADRVLFETAVIEIAGNIAQHAPDGVSLQFTLNLWVRPDRVEAEFRDHGRHVDIDLGAIALPDDSAESGRGLAMARAAVDELQYRRDGSTNHWCIVRRRQL
jgi:anti-sigma regulatory factor (Ser/Thr protein kinase)